MQKARVRKKIVSQENARHESRKSPRVRKTTTSQENRQSKSREKPTSHEKSRYGHLLKSFFFHLARSKEKTADTGGSQVRTHVKITSFSPSDE